MALVPDGRSTAEFVQSALRASEHLALIQQRLYSAPEDQRADALLGLLADVSAAQRHFDGLADELVLALRDVCAPPVPWSRIGPRLGVKETAVRNRYTRGAAGHPDHLTLCTVRGGCGELRPAELPDGSDPWKHHDDDHAGNPELPQSEDDEA
ncbi:hypothetical protein [Kitasatospora sp. NBC_01300]|uniref:hypothetical protein n=1 Tax=Kitasatospora sp. NBC_01300 TaxID=2903574 RepID=UPI002F909FC3|nr:hypothetical protein OG556_40035 [Kitasatospora sp. NBC_01300]